MLSGYSNSINTNFNVSPVQIKRQAPTVSAVQNNTYSTAPSFKGVTPDVGIRTSLSTKEEKKEYKYLTKTLDKDTRKMLQALLKSGKLLNNSSNDGSTTLENLYKMATNPRAEGINAKLLLSQTVQTIYNPHIITQRFGDIPEEYQNTVIDTLSNNSKNYADRSKAQTDLNELYSGCCPAASEEFSLASKNPAEFARFAEGLTSPEKSVKKQIKMDSLSDKTLDAIWLLNAFEIPYEAKDFNTATVTIAPDKNAYIRESVQERYQDPQERSSLDVLMQSTFMNVGSQQTYNSLNDRRGGKFSLEDKGLIEFEKTFVESIVEDKNITSVIYQKVDENQHVTGYEADYNTVKDQLLETLNTGHNIIIGYTMTDESSKIIGGHEITITSANTGANGELYFVCNDTDDDNPNPIVYPAAYLIPKIHHAGIPTEIAEKNMKQVDNWVLGVREFNERMNSNQQQG